MGQDLEPRVFWRLTDNWLELTVRFVVKDRGVREVKDAISRDILAAFDEARIGIASATYDIVGMPPIVIDQRGSGAVSQLRSIGAHTGIWTGPVQRV